MRTSFAAFEKVYQRELPFVWAAARRLGVHPAAIDDAVQDVFLTAYRRWGDIHHDVSPRAWLYGVTRRVAFRYRRSHARTARRKAAVAHDGEGRSDAPHRQHDEAHDVDAVLAVLEPKRREVFVMSELLEMTAPEIASQLEIPVNTVYSRLRLARRELEPRLRRGVGAWAGGVRERERPTNEQAQRTWAGLVPLLGQGAGTGGVLGAWSLGRVLGVAAAVGVVSAAAIAGGRAERAGEREERIVEAVVDAKDGRRREREAEMPSPSPVPSVTTAEPEGTTAASMPAPATEPTPVESKPPSAASSRASAPSPRSPAPAAEPGPIEPPSPGLEEEVAVLDRATAALREGDAAHALQWLTEHERQFPTGRLVDVRKATRVRALCRLGRAAQAKAEAAALRREHPRSTLAQRTPLECEKS